MTSSEIRQKYLKFFEERGHKRIKPAPLVLENDPTTLFTSSGMQPLVPYLKGLRTHPRGVRLVDVQPSFRAEDIEEVGDNRHTTFFEMLGNWSLGNYFKKEQLAWFWEFLIKELELPKNKLHVSVFEGDGTVGKDEESYSIWKDLGVEEDHIHWYGAKKNWWSRSGPPETMVVGDIGGPDSEVFYDFGEELSMHKTSLCKDEPCHPNCDCGRFLEIGNSVFIQYKKIEDGTLEELPQKSVDFGGGLERLTAVSQNQPDIFKIDLLWPIIGTVCSQLGAKGEIKYSKDQETDKALRVIADHMRAAVFLIKDNVTPSNKMQGYLLRRLIRRAAVKFTSLGGQLGTLNIAAVAVINAYEDTDFLRGFEEKVQSVLYDELEKFRLTLDKGLKEIAKRDYMDGKAAFDLYQSYGFPLELTEELLLQKGQQVDKNEFYSEFEKHKELSRTASAGMFKGGLSSIGETETKYHTATHLLHAALRKILGEHVVQRGSNITAERLRFDFAHNEKVIPEQLKEVEELVNQKIEEDLPVSFEEMGREEAEKTGAIHAFGEKYGQRVKVYTIGPTLHDASRGVPFSREFCGGPHVARTGEIGMIKIQKEESAGSGIRRIYATICE